LSVGEDDDLVEGIAIVVSVLSSDEGFIDRVNLCIEDFLVGSKMELLRRSSNREPFVQKHAAFKSPHLNSGIRRVHNDSSDSP
jgi:hypothetical protein